MKLSTLLVPITLSFVTASCGSAPPAPPLRASSVEWNGAHATIGAVTAIAELDDTTVLFSNDAATVVVGGAVASVDRSVHRWVDAAVVPALDGNGRWIVGVDGDGKVWRLRARKSFEPISDRLGLAGSTAHAICAAGSRVAVLLDHELALAALAKDGRVTRVPVEGTALACGASLVAVGGEGGIRLFSSTGSDRTIALPTTHVAFADKDRLLALVRGRLYAMDGMGTMRSVTPREVSVATLASNADGAWIAWPGSLGWFDGSTVTHLSDPNIGADARLFTSANGDAWLSAPRGLSRFHRGSVASTDPWQGSIAPIVATTCRNCHGPEGTTGTELMTEAEWNANKSDIRDRVLVKKDMPPKGGLTDAERAAIAAFVAH
jgi:cytochrome c5